MFYYQFHSMIPCFLYLLGMFHLQNTYIVCPYIYVPLHRQCNLYLPLDFIISRGQTISKCGMSISFKPTTSLHISICSNRFDICLLLVVSVWSLHQPINVSPTKSFGINRVDTGLTNASFLGNYIKMGFGCIFMSADLYPHKVGTFLALVLNGSCIVLKTIVHNVKLLSHILSQFAVVHNHVERVWLEVFPKIVFPQAFKASGGTQLSCNMYRWTQEFWNRNIIQIICLFDFLLIQCSRNGTSNFKNGLF